MNSESANTSPDLSRRAAGVLLHVSSLPGEYGIGDLGPAAHRWIQLLAQAGQSWWQMLPLGPCDEGNSPYRCYSAFAGNPLLISPQRLVEDQLLSSADLRTTVFPRGRVNYEAILPARMRLLQIAFKRFQSAKEHPLSIPFKIFIKTEQGWLDDFATFLALRDAYTGQSWTQWPMPLRRRQSSALSDFREQFADEIELHQFTQFLFFHQLQLLRDFASKAGIWLIGDMPIFVSPESADVWTNPSLFQLDRHLQPSAVAGVPPDLFSSSGQCWGNPLYNWTQMARDDFAWWKSRLAAAMKQADLIRLDHFRGFEAYWRIPAGAATAQNGKWVKAPGVQFFQSLLHNQSSLPLLAEDLGVITPEVEALRDRFGFPGMRVLQFGFSGQRGDPHSPHNFIHHCFAYTATHDNDTTAGWFASLSTKARHRLMQYAPDPLWNTNPSWALIRILYASTAGQAIVPLQDLLSLDTSARMNTPGQSRQNWEWRLDSFAQCSQGLRHLSKLVTLYERDRQTDHVAQESPSTSRKNKK